MKVLVADDDAVSREALAIALQRLGYETLICEDGAQAWETLEAPDAPRLAILDWMMPAPDGVEICRRVRALDHRPYQYVIELKDEHLAGATTDEPSGLLNAAGVRDGLQRRLDESARSGVPVSVIVTQLEDIEAVDGEHGTAAGDEVLSEAVRRLSVHLRPNDEPGRIGRAEFVATLPGCTRADALLAAADAALFRSRRAG